jgi:hypothetical protein
MLVKNIADHFRPWVKKHVVPEGRRPIRHGESGAFAGHQTPNEQQRKSGPGKDDRHPMRPNAFVAWSTYDMSSFGH